MAEDKDIPGAEAASAPPAPRGTWLPPLLALLVAVVAAPAGTWALAHFVLLPQLREELVTVARAAGAGEIRAPGAKPARAGAQQQGSSYKFENVVVNLAGTMGTRYLKTTFIITGSNPHIPALFEENRVRLVDVTLNVLSSLTLADLEEIGARNLIRERLVGAYNQTLGGTVAEQIYFADFVVQ